MGKKVYIHFGANHFDKGKFKPIKNKKSCTKPYGGFWASPVGTSYGWYAWSIENNWYGCNIAAMPCITFNLKDSSKVYTIRSIKDLEWLVEYGLADKNSGRNINGILTPMYYIDFELMANRYDAIEVEMMNDYTSMYWALYGWDCDSILIMNPGIVEEV